MRKLAIAAAVSMSLATLSVNTHALGLGEIEMFSALNQTLDAEIGIVSYSPQELEGLNVRLASEQAFATAGLARPQMLDQIQFDIERRPDGVPVIKISSDGPIIEPFISFLLELESPAGTAVVRVQFSGQHVIARCIDGIDSQQFFATVVKYRKST